MTRIDNQKDALKEVSLVTLRSPVPTGRYSKFFNTLNRAYNATLITGVHSSNPLRMSPGTFLSYATLFSKVHTAQKPTIIDVNALAVTLLKPKKSVVVDFRTPLSYELKWLGHNFLARVAQVIEYNLNNIGLVTTANEQMAKYCLSLGAKATQIVPNYPTKDLKASISLDRWKESQNLSLDQRIVLFTGGVRLREIYGLDILLESWKIVEESTDNATLVILGDDSLEYIRKTARSLNIKRLMLPGKVSKSSVANWINSVDVCVAPRTAGFSDVFYNDKDSHKISEYAAFNKPIVAAGYSQSEQYLLVNATATSFAEGILKGLNGQIKPSKAHYWEDNEEDLLSSLDNFWFN